MTDFTKYRNISVSYKVYADLEDISSKRIPGVKLSISKTVETLAAKEKLILNKKEDDKRAQD
tara:strand:+ start:328 stop:513 length:186 start_codon:yes stop_codon:yes gene_type:complete